MSSRAHDKIGTPATSGKSGESSTSMYAISPVFPEVAVVCGKRIKFFKVSYSTIHYCDKLKQPTRNTIQELGLVLVVLVRVIPAGTCTQLHQKSYRSMWQTILILDSPPIFLPQFFQATL